MITIDTSSPFWCICRGECTCGADQRIPQDEEYLSDFGDVLKLDHNDDCLLAIEYTQWLQGGGKV